MKFPGEGNVEARVPDPAKIKQFWEWKDLMMSGVGTLENIENSGLPKEKKLELYKLLTQRQAWDLGKARETISSQRKDLERAEIESGTDSMTGALNRKYLSQIMESLLRQLNNPESPGLGAVVVISFDLDELKELNDSMGHHVGDEAIHTLIGHIAEITRSRDHLFRLGGDEFTLVIPLHDAPHKKTEPFTFAGSIIDELNRDFLVDRGSDSGRDMVRLHVSGGIAVAKRGTAKTFDELFKEADENMYRNKRQSRDRREAERGAERRKGAERGRKIDPGQTEFSP